MRRLGDIAELVKGELLGDPNLVIRDAKTIRNASASDLTFATTEKHINKFLECASVAAIIPSNVSVDSISASEDTHFILIENDVENAFAEVVKLFRPEIIRKPIGISEHAIVDESARIADDVDIYPNAYVGPNVSIGCGSVIHPNVTIMENCQVGANTTIFPGATLYENTIVGDRCLIHGGAVLGAFGFGYRSTDIHELSSQLGNVVIGNDVEIGSNTTIDRGTYDSTTIGDGTKLDNLVMIGHNCQIGRHNMLCSQVGIAGSCSTGDYVVMAGQVGIGDHLDIGNKTVVAAQSGVMHNLKGDQVYLGSPAIPVREQMQLHAITSKLPELRKQIRRLQKTVEQLESQEPNSQGQEPHSEAA